MRDSRRPGCIGPSKTAQCTNCSEHCRATSAQRPCGLPPENGARMTNVRSSVHDLLRTPVMPRMDWEIRTGLLLYHSDHSINRVARPGGNIEDVESLRALDCGHNSPDKVIDIQIIAARF